MKTENTWFRNKNKIPDKYADRLDMGYPAKRKPGPKSGLASYANRILTMIASGVSLATTIDVLQLNRNTVNAWIADNARFKASYKKAKEVAKRHERELGEILAGVPILAEYDGEYAHIMTVSVNLDFTGDEFIIHAKADNTEWHTFFPTGATPSEAPDAQAGFMRYLLDHAKNGGRIKLVDLAKDFILWNEVLAVKYGWPPITKEQIIKR